MFQSKCTLYFVPNRNACYHVGGEQVSQAKAEVACGKLGGRLASFVDKTSIDKLQLALQPWITSAEMWLGKRPLLVKLLGFL